MFHKSKKIIACAMSLFMVTASLSSQVLASTFSDVHLQNEMMNDSQKVVHAPAQLPENMILLNEISETSRTESGDIVISTQKVYQYPTRTASTYYLETYESFSNASGTYLTIKLDADFEIDIRGESAKVTRYYSSYPLVKESQLISDSSNGYLTDFETDAEFTSDWWTAYLNARVTTHYEIKKANGQVETPTLTLAKYATV